MAACMRLANLIVIPTRKLLQKTLSIVPITNQWRPLTLSHAQQLKRIIEIQDGNVTTIEAEYVRSPREDFLAKFPHSEEACPLCKLNMEVKYTDVLILSQFLRPDGCPLPRRVTGLCQKQQRILLRLVRQAQQAGLMPEFRPDLPGGKQRTNLKSNYKFKKYNVYFETRSEIQTNYEREKLGRLYVKLKL